MKATSRSAIVEIFEEGGFVRTSSILRPVLPLAVPELAS